MSGVGDDQPVEDLEERTPDAAPDPEEFEPTDPDPETQAGRAGDPAADEGGWPAEQEWENPPTPGDGGEPEHSP